MCGNGNKSLHWSVGSELSTVEIYCNAFVHCSNLLQSDLLSVIIFTVSRFFLLPNM